MIQTFLIFLAFACIHSITVSLWFKRLCGRLFGDVFLRVWYRFLYTALSTVTAGIAIALILRVPDRVLWEAPSWFAWTLRAVQLGGAVFGMRAFEHLDAQEFLGLRQVRRYLARGEVAGNSEGLADRGLITTGVYGIVRHPLYVAGIVIVTFSPRITVNGLALTVLADLYFLFGMMIEERRFLRIFGDQYRRYMRQVPRMVPDVFGRGGTGGKERTP